MASVLVIGASRGLGLATTRQALAAGHRVRALARSAGDIDIAHPALEKCSGDALEHAQVASALAGVDVVIQTLGIRTGEMLGPVRLFSQATRVLVAAMQAQGPRRLVCLTGFGAGASAERISPLQWLPFQLVFGRAYADKSRQERLVIASGLDWTIVRPGVLTGGPGTGRYQVLIEPRQWRNGFIARADVAAFLVRQISERDCIGRAPVLVN